MVDVVVVGAGVIGLSAAIELRNRGLSVVVFAKDLPEDTESVGFASPWAGCNWHSFESESSTRQAHWDRTTFHRLADLAKRQPDLCKRIPFFTVWSDPSRASKIWFQDLVADYKSISSDDSKLPGDKPFGHSFSSYIINAPEYLAYLGRTVRALGIPIHRKRLTSLDQAFNLNGIGKVPLVVNATGLGARTMIGVEDPAVYPARGQTVLVRSPEVSRCVMHVEGFMAVAAKEGEEAPPEPAYIIPRPGPDGFVVLGGTYIKDDYSPLPDLKVSERILRDCYKLEPKLAGPSGKDRTDIEVISHNVGHRPAREGGARLEIQDRKDLRSSPLVNVAKGEREGAVIHAYGFGSAGYQCSLGVAEEIASMAQRYIARPTTRTIKSKL